MYEIRDINLAASGEQKIEWAKSHMPLLNGIQKDFEKNRPLEGLRVALSVHLEAKTAYLCRVLASGGADMYITGSNPLSTQDDVAAALAKGGLRVYAWHDATPEEYNRHVRMVVEKGPHIVIDDGGDLVNMLHNEFPNLCDDVLGGCEETTTGVMRLVAMHNDNALRFPMILVNDAECKHLFDNRYGTGQSVWDAINKTTNLIAAGKTTVVNGYGWCGKGVAMRAKGQGCQVVVTEIDPVRALEAHMDGFAVMTMDQAAPVGDIFVTVTGNRDIITKDHFAKMKDGAILCNAGHFDVEIDMVGIRDMATETKEQRHNIVGYKMPSGNWLSVLGEGRLVNLAAGDGHPVEIMDMSFAIQALSAQYLAQNKVTEKILPVPKAIDHDVARRKLAYTGLDIDTLTKEQQDYLESWQVD